MKQNKGDDIKLERNEKNKHERKEGKRQRGIREKTQGTENLFTLDCVVFVLSLLLLF